LLFAFFILALDFAFLLLSHKKVNGQESMATCFKNGKKQDLTPKTLDFAFLLLSHKRSKSKD